MRYIGITIDWDYFTPYDSMWDIQHVESLLYLDFLWKARGHLVDTFKTSGEEASFWPWLREHFTFDEVFNEAYLWVSDSHALIVKDWRIWHASDVIISFDQHHDCWPTEEDNRDEEGRMEHIACHTWGRAWLEENPDRRLVWVYPDHLDIEEYGDFETVEGVRDQLIILPRKEFDASYYDEDEVSGVHVCRSGCWTPPWLDSAFRKFIHESGMLKKILQNGEWDPMRIRWVQKDFEEAKRMYEEGQRACERFARERKTHANQRQG